LNPNHVLPVYLSSSLARCRAHWNQHGPRSFLHVLEAHSGAHLDDLKALRANVDDGEIGVDTLDDSASCQRIAA